jgi:hypothetical protein
VPCIVSEAEFLGFNAWLKSKRGTQIEKSLLYNSLLTHFKNFSTAVKLFIFAPRLDSGYALKPKNYGGECG